MDTFEVLNAIQNSAIAHAISKSNHMVGAGLQVIHVLGLVMFLASLVLIALRVAELALTRQTIAEVARDSLRLLWGGLIFTALSGTLMFIATPKLYYFNAAFGLKMLLMVFALIVQFTLFRKVARGDFASLAFARASVGVSLVSWFSVAMAGRMIGFI